MLYAQRSHRTKSTLHFPPQLFHIVNFCRAKKREHCILIETAGDARALGSKAFSVKMARKLLGSGPPPMSRARHSLCSSEAKKKTSSIYKQNEFLPPPPLVFLPPLPRIREFHRMPKRQSRKRFGGLFVRATPKWENNEVFEWILLLLRRWCWDPKLFEILDA